MSASRAYLSLGSNMGAREAAIFRAVRVLDARVASVTGLSSLYETEPVDCGSPNTFVNAVAEVRSLLLAEDLLQRLQAIERELGRRGGHNEPRTLDIDIVVFGAQVIRSAQLVVPHPRYQERLFVLLPLRELAPEFRCPVTGQGIDVMVDRLGHEQGVTRISSRRVVSAPSSAPTPPFEMQHG